MNRLYMLIVLSVSLGFMTACSGSESSDESADSDTSNNSSNTDSDLPKSSDVASNFIVDEVPTHYSSGTTDKQLVVKNDTETTWYLSYSFRIFGDTNELYFKAPHEYFFYRCFCDDCESCSYSEPLGGESGIYPIHVFALQPGDTYTFFWHSTLYELSEACPSTCLDEYSTTNETITLDFFVFDTPPVNSWNEVNRVLVKSEIGYPGDASSTMLISEGIGI